MSLARRLAFVVALVALAGASCDDEPLPQGLPIAETEKARELRIKTIPPVEQISREEYTRQQTERGEQITDSRERFLRDSVGRMGFIPQSYDLRAASGQTSSLFAAYYSSETKKVTLIGEPAKEIVVHELVHALQDQHFDLTEFRKDVMSSDEALAKTALVEGDATTAQYRHVFFELGGEYAPYRLRDALTYPYAEERSVELLVKNGTVPPYFLAVPAFAYSYGAVYALRVAGVPGPGEWGWGRVNDTYRAGNPLTTKKVMRPDAKDEPLEVGLTRLPAPVVGLYAIDGADRIGAWLTYLLFFKTASPGLPDLVGHWSGDQLVTLHRRDTRVGTPNGPGAIVWTSAWEETGYAERVVGELSVLHGLEQTTDDPSRTFRAKDGEDVWIERRGRVVVFVKNVPSYDARVLADRAFATPDQQKTLPVQSRIFEGPKSFSCTLTSDRALRP